jgi:hypothetical protein
VESSSIHNTEQTLLYKKIKSIYIVPKICNVWNMMIKETDGGSSVKYFEDLFEIWAFLLWRSKWSTHVHQTKDYNAYSQKKEDNFSKARRYKCSKCKEFGHKASDCKQLSEDKKDDEDTTPPKNQAQPRDTKKANAYFATAFATSRKK